MYFRRGQYRERLKGAGTPTTDHNAAGTLTSYRDDPMWESFGIPVITAEELNAEQLKLHIRAKHEAAIERKRSRLLAEHHAEVDQGLEDERGPFDHDHEMPPTEAEVHLSPRQAALRPREQAHSGTRRGSR